jgi:hypothetical protein
MKIISLEITNLRKIKAAMFKFSVKGGVTEIVGGNQQGKSTVLDAIMILLFGPKFMTGGATTKGAEKTEIKGEFDNGYIVKRVFTEKTDRIELNRILDGKLYPESSPQSFLDGITNIIAIRPVAFLGKNPAEKTKIIAQCLGIEKALEQYATSIKEFEGSRALIGQEIKAFGKLAEFNPELTEPKSIKEIQGRVDQADESNRILIQEAADKFKQWNNRKEKYEFNQQLKPQIYKALSDLKERFATLWEGANRAEMTMLKEFTLSEIKRIDEFISLHKGEFLETSFLEESPEPLDGKLLIDVEAIKAEMETVVEYNLSVEHNLQVKAAKESLLKLQDKYTSTDAHIQNLKENRVKTISAAAANAGFPFKVDIADNDIFIEGIDSANWSTSQALLFALEACKLLNPTLKTVCIDNAEAFDNTNLTYLEKWAEANDIQTVITIVQGEHHNDTDSYFLEEGIITNNPFITSPMDSQIPVKEEKEKKTKEKKILEVPKPEVPELPETEEW